MLPLDNPKWETLKGGYRTPYDARPALLRLERGEDAWDEIWENLHHQGDVGEASYAAVPCLVSILKTSDQRDSNFYGFVSTIEIERHRKTNPPLPDWLRASYRASWTRLCELALHDLQSANEPLLVQQALAVIALAKRKVKLGMMLSYTDQSELDQCVEEHDAWSDLYSSER
jgi:hypothetical protein